MAKASFWWRDDDFGRWIERSRKICQLSQKTGVPLLVAVVPYRLAVSDKEMQREISKFSKTVAFCVHGFDHLSHNNESPSEYPPNRELEAGRAELDYGIKRVRSVFGSMFKPVFVPPWNHIAPHFADCLPELGYKGLSGVDATKTPKTSANFHNLPIQIDLLDYRERPFKLRPMDGLKKELKAAFEAGQATGRNFEVGILTHHVEMEDQGIADLETLLNYAFSLGFEPLVNHPMLPNG